MSRIPPHVARLAGMWPATPGPLRGAPEPAQRHTAAVTSPAEAAGRASMPARRWLRFPRHARARAWTLPS
ncbi:hypothetical protein [Intrasporangium sp. DVR]|uniref:hypothetical protein n=1 Tax=Intrasporangium sp. DVR TaxID=3127867 RepID=UPI00333FE57A